MSYQKLVSVLTVPAAGTLAPGASVTLPHGLIASGKGLSPRLILPDRGTPIVVTAYTSTTVTFQNSSATDPATARFWVESGYSKETAPNSVVPAFTWQGGVGGGGGLPVGPAGGVLGYPGSTYPNPNGLAAQVIGVNPLDISTIPLVPVAGQDRIIIRPDPAPTAPEGTRLYIAGGDHPTDTGRVVIAAGYGGTTQVKPAGIMLDGYSSFALDGAGSAGISSGATTTHSGLVYIETAGGNIRKSGDITIRTGDTYHANAGLNPTDTTGSLYLYTAPSVDGNTGNITISVGTSQNYKAGNVLIKAGNSTNLSPGSPGDVTIMPGQRLALPDYGALNLGLNQYPVPAVTAGSLLVAPSIGVFAELPVGANGTLLTVAAGVPSWQPASSLAIAGDVTGTLAASLVAQLQGRPMSNVAPTAGQAIVWSGSAWAPATISGGGAGGGGYTYFLNYNVSGGAPAPSGTTKQLSFQYNAGASINTGAITPPNGGVYATLAQFVTDVGDPGATTVPPGLFEVGLYAVTSHVDGVFCRAKLSKWDGVTLTPLATSDDVEFAHTTLPADLGNISFYVPAVTLTASERLVLTIETTRTVAPARTITAYFEGNTPSHCHTTFGAPGGTGLVKVVNGVVQDPASLLVDSDVAIGANIAVSKLAASSVTVTAGTGLSGGGLVALGGSITLNLADTTVTAGSYGSASSVGTFTVNAQGQLTLAGNASIAIAASQVTSGVLSIARGGTNTSTIGAANALAYSDGSKLVYLPIGSAGQFLVVSGGAPTWANPTAGGILGYTGSTYPNPTGLRAVNVGGNSTIPLLPLAGYTSLTFQPDTVSGATSGTTVSVVGGDTTGSSSGGRARLAGGDSSLGTGGAAEVRAGSGVTGGATVIYGGDNNIVSGASSSIYVGGSTATGSGEIVVSTYNVSGASGAFRAYTGTGDTTGNIQIYTGDGTTSSGVLQLYTGNTDTGAVGFVDIRVGTTTSGTAGSLTIASGSAVNTGVAPGNISISAGFNSTDAVYGNASYTAKTHTFFGGVVIGGNTYPTTNAAAGSLIYASALKTYANLALGTTGQALTVAAGLPAWGTVGVAGGGTGITSYTIGDILYASGTSALSKLAGVATGNVLLSGGVGVAPSWGKVGLTTHVSGTLPVANGGTGVSTAPANGQLLIGNGTGYTQANLTAGSGVSITNGAGTVTISATAPSGGSAANGTYKGITSADSPYTVLSTDYCINLTSGSATANLPTAASAGAGRMYVLKNSDGGTLTIAANGAETIDGASTISVPTQYASYTLMSTGSSWIII